MYQDYTAIAILLLTAIPVLAVAATVFFYIRSNDRKTPLTREDFYRWHDQTCSIALAIEPDSVHNLHPSDCLP